MAHTARIAVIGGDGIGPEVTSVGEAVLRAVAEAHRLPLRVEALDLGAERFLRDGTTLPDATFERLRDRTDAILLGALGDPRVPDMRHARDILLGLRRRLDLCCNIRPVVCLSDRLMPLVGHGAGDCRMVIFRENVEGEYVDAGTVDHAGTPDEVAVDHAVHTRRNVERVVRAAFDHARAHELGHVLLTDKHNAIPRGHGLWHRVFREVSADYPDIASDHLFVDALCLRLVQAPEAMRVIVTTNLLGDVVSDLAAGLAGGLGLAPSANVHPGRRPGLFEPVHGSAPDLAGRDVANPLATVRTVGLMLAHLGWPALQARLEGICREAVETGHCTADVGGHLGTRATGQWVVERVLQGSSS
ncbi:MAG: isocitrate/isopropylmalate dehydrogenase family protein [Myxococcota bacterium]